MEDFTYCVSYLQYIGQLQVFVSVLNTHPIDTEIILNLFLKNLKTFPRIITKKGKRKYFTIGWVHTYIIWVIPKCQFMDWGQPPDGSISRPRWNDKNKDSLTKTHRFNWKVYSYVFCVSVHMCVCMCVNIYPFFADDVVIE